MNDRVTAGASRLHGLDALRLFLMLLGIPYHAALIYSVHAEWLIRSPHESAALTVLSILLHSFRMAGFFLLSGFFAALVIGRRGKRAWLRAKVIQLAVPLLVCAVILTPPQVFLAALVKFPQPMAHLHDAWAQTLSTLSQPSKLWVLHLWFLIDLLLICVAFGLCWGRVAPALARRGLDRAERLAGGQPAVAQAAMLGCFLLVALAVQVLHKALHVPVVTLFHGLIQVESTLYYAAFFAFGAMLQLRAGLLAWFQRFSLGNLLLGLVALAACVVAERSSAHLAQSLLLFVQTISAICVTRFLFWVVMRLLHQPVPVIRRAADAAFTLYLLHHPIVALLAFFCVQNAVPPLLAWSGIVILTTLITLSLHWYVIAPSRVLSFLLNGRLQPSSLARPSLSQVAAE